MVRNVNNNKNTQTNNQRVTVQLNYGNGSQPHHEMRPIKRPHHAANWPSQSSGPVNINNPSQVHADRIQPHGQLLDYPAQIVAKASDHSAMPEYFKKAYARIHPMIKKTIHRDDLTKVFGAENLIDQNG